MYPVYLEEGRIHSVSSVSEDLTLCISHLGEIGESMTPEPHRSSTSAPDGLPVISEHNGDDPDASFAAYDRLIG